MKDGQATWPPSWTETSPSRTINAGQCLVPLNLFIGPKTYLTGLGPTERPVSSLAKQLIDYRHDGFLAARGTALAGLLIGCLLYIF